jgi:hypothetical protein
MWKNRIVGLGEETPDQLLANINNWRIHGTDQQALFTKVVNDIGVISPVLVNSVTGRII